jgi:hypothetical protein
MFFDPEDLVGPVLFVGRQLATAVVQGVGQHGPPAGDVVEGDAHGMLDELRHAWRRAGADEGSYAVELILVEGDCDLLCRHTNHHTNASFMTSTFGLSVFSTSSRSPSQTRKAACLR